MPCSPIMPTSDSRFNYAVGIVLEHEGCVEAMSSRDKGLVTKWGISLRFMRAIGMDINNDGIVNAEDVLALTPAEARTIYKTYWWDAYNYNCIVDLNIATKVFDLSVNMGPNSAHKLAQIAVNRLQISPIAVDGIFGPETIAQINMKNADDYMAQLRDCAAHYYIELVAENPTLKIYENGWLARARW
jgi:lysozyme family protein